MGTARPDDFLNDPIAVAMVHAGAAELRNPARPVTASVSVAEMARRVGVTERTGYNKWDAEDFQITLIREVLELNVGADLTFDPGELLESARSIIEDPTIAPRDALGLVFEFAWKRLIDDPRAQVVGALSTYAHREGRVAEAIRESLSQAYENWVQQLISVLDAFVARNSRLVAVRNDLSTKEMAMVALILAEGAASHSRLARSMGRETFSDDLPGKVLQALLGYAIVFHDDDGPHPLDKHLARLDPS